MQRAPLGKAQALGSLCARPQAAAVWRVPVLWATLLGVSVLWCVGALAPWFAQGAGQLRRQGGSTCHLARPVVAAPAVAVLTRPPVPCQPQKQPPPLRVVLLSSLCRRRLLSSPSSFAVAVLLSPLCRRGLFCPFSFFVAVIPPASRPLLVSSLCRRRLPAAATAGAQRHRRWDCRRCRPWTHGRRRPRWYVPPPAARSCASICPRRRTPCCTRACRWRSVRALPARVGAPALVEEGGGAISRRRCGCKNNH